jgi:hypothetical protein
MKKKKGRDLSKGGGEREGKRQGMKKKEREKK